MDKNLALFIRAIGSNRRFHIVLLKNINSMASQRALFIAVLVGSLYLASAGPAPQIEYPRGSSRIFRPDVSSTRAKVWGGGGGMLPLTVIPTYYNVSIRPILYTDESGTEWTAPGHVDISFQVAGNATNYLVLHRHPTLTIDETSIKISTVSGPDTINGFNYNDTQQSLQLKFQRDLVAGQNYTLSMDFVALVSEAQDGMYRAIYHDSAKRVRRMATTQFEFYGARRAFPCFDEPRFKTPFEISLGRKATLENYITLSNGALAQSSIPDPQLPDWVWDRFAPTVPMPTYTVAMIVADFEYANATEGLFDKPVRVYSQPAHIQRNGGQLSADSSARALRFLSQKFDYPYEMPKMDSVAIPRNYFWPGAMENWGLVTYRDNFLMYYENETSEAVRNIIHFIISHELAHQWFGNLVTCRYWTNLWLNEGFATYATHVVLQQEFKEYEGERQMLWSSVQASMAFDTTNNHPIMNPNDPLDGYSGSSTIVYDKAGSIIRLMEGFLTKETLTRGIQLYLKRNAYGTAVQDDLWEALEEVAREDGRIPADKTIKQIMDTWTTQPGYPLVRASYSVLKQKMTLTQERFGPLNNASAPANWEIPLTFKSPFTNISESIWLNESSMTLPLSPYLRLLYVNNGVGGYYRVLYDETWRLLIEQALAYDRSAINPLTRSQLIDDYFAFESYGLIPSIEYALGMTAGLDQETDFVVWYTLFDNMEKILNIFRHIDLPAVQAYFAPALDAAIDRIGWDQPEGEHGTKVLYRARLIDWACALETPGCVHKSQALLVQWQDSPSDNPIGFDLQPVMYCAIVANAGEAGYNFTYSMYRNATTEVQRSRLRNAMQCATKSGLIYRILNKTLKDPLSVDGYVHSIVQGVGSTTAGRQIAFDFLLSDSTFDRLLELYKSVNPYLSILRTLSSYWTTEGELTQLKLFAASRKELQSSSAKESLAKTVSNIKLNIAWVKKYYGSIKLWFEENSSGYSTALHQNNTVKNF